MLSGWKVATYGLAVSLSLSLLPSAKAELTGNLTVEISGLKNQRGDVCLKLFSDSRGFPSGRESGSKSQCVKITAAPVKVTFKNLKVGSYAIAVFHDSNRDRTLNQNFLGIPQEGYGFSKNPAIRQGPPKFGEAAFLLAGSETRLTIQMRYFMGL